MAGPNLVGGLAVAAVIVCLISRTNYVRAEVTTLARHLYGGDQRALIAALEE